MKKGDDDERGRSKSELHEFDFFDENRTGPRHIYNLLPQESSSISPAMNRRSEYDDDGEQKKNRSKKRKWEEIKHNQIPPHFLRRVVNEIQDHQVALLFDKKLEFSDVGQRQNQLLIAGSERVMGALTEEERWKVEREGFLEVRTIDPRENKYKMRLKHMSAIGVAVISDEWFKLVSANQLEEGETVQGWGFRKGGKFRFAINFIRKL